MKKSMRNEDFDELWKMTEGTPTCLKCDSSLIYGHIREVNGDLATVDWVCKDWGYKWSNRCPFEDGCLIPIEDDDTWIGLCM